MSRRILGMLLICVAFACQSPSACAADEEPSFLDKKLSHWLGLLETGKDAKTRRRGVIAVEQIGPASKKVLPALVKAMQDKEPIVRKAATRAVGRTVAKTVELVRSKKEDPPRFDAARDALAAALRTDKEPEVREAAALAIGDLGGEAKPVLGTLTQALKDKDAATVKAAASSMRRIGPAARDAQAELWVLLADKKADKGARTDAAIALGQIGPDVKPALPVLEEVLADAKADAFLRKAVADSLGKMGKDAADSSAALGAVLTAKDSPNALRLAAVNALDQFGPEAKAAIPALIAAVADPALVKTFGENARFIRGQALHALGQMGKELDKKRAEAVKAILAASEDPSVEVCVAAIETLAVMYLDGYGGLQADVVKRLDAIVRREGRKSIRDAAEAALAKIRPKKS
jgi:HEAT repeat protein